MSKYTEEQLRGMGYADSEVDAYFGRDGDDATDEEEADAEIVAEDLPEEEEADEETEADEGEAEEADEEAEKPDAKPADEEPAAETQAEAAPEPIKDSSRYRPTPEPFLVSRDASGNEVQVDEAGVTQRLDAITAERKAISMKLATGEISDEEAEDQRLALEAERDMIRDHLSDCRAVRRANKDRWEAAQEAFFETDVGKQLSASVSRYRFAALREALHEVEISEDARGKSYWWMLQTAGAKVAKDLQLPVAAESARPAAGKPKLRAVASKGVPTTLADLPAAAANGARQIDEHEAIDRLDGEALALKVARMSPAERTRYLRGGRG